MNRTPLIVAGVAGLTLAACGTIFEEDLDRVTQDVQELRQGNDPFAGRAGGGNVAAAGESRAAGQSQAAGSTAQRAEAAPPVTQKLVRGVQQELKSEGFDPGPVDGVWGPKTSGAVREFQKAQGLEASGQLNARTLAELGVGGGPTAAAGGSSDGNTREVKLQRNDLGK
jgi:peptidoglycan hydrolase-like protein with peptidoglycan-binding domain